MVSFTSGVFELYRRHFCWIPVDPDTGENNVNDGLFFNYSKISNWTWGENPDDMIIYLAIFSKTEVFKFFPFTRFEIVQLSKALHDVIMTDPFDPHQFAVSRVNNHVDNQRITVVQQLATKPKWIINHTNELYHVINDLINPAKPQSLANLERVYHSCRYSKEVMKETIADLKRKWAKGKSSEVIRVKILIIVDRVLSKTLLNRETFVDLYEWLTIIEEHLDPYKSPESLKRIHLLKTKCDSLKQELVQPFSEKQLDDNFEFLDDYEERLMLTT
ncbi:hypothetical protein GEMRC1_011509 [Eukaryota sp. GEM-RC1]